jgi:RIMS-binding protein 2
MQGGPRSHTERGRPPNPPNTQFGPTIPGQQPQSRMPLQPGQQRSQQMQQQQQQKKTRYFLAMFDYDPMTMSPNPDSCEEELPFREGDTIKV